MAKGGTICKDSRREGGKEGVGHTAPHCMESRKEGVGVGNGGEAREGSLLGNT